MLRHGSGFTLVEMLVAIALLSLVSIISWRGLEYVAAQRARVASETEALGRILRVFAQIERDLEQRAPEFILPGTPQVALFPKSVAVTGTGSGDISIEILRMAPQVTGPVRLQRVIYRVVAGVLVRVASVASDGWPSPAASEALPLYDGTRRLGVRVLSANVWSEYGMPGWVSARTPATGIEITLEEMFGGRYVRVFTL